MLLSPGTEYKSVPKSLTENLAYRQWVLRRANNNPRFRDKVLDVVRHDALWYVNTFVWQFNPKKKGAATVAPFISWDFQDEMLLDRPETTGRKGILWCIEHDRSAVCQKSRDMGISWWFLITQDWLGQTQPHFQCLNISRDADAVDSKSPDSLFWKLRFMHSKLPEWLRGEIETNKFYFHYKRTGSVNTGEASTAKAGVGGRARVIFVDEFPQIEAAVEVRQRTAGTADCRFFNGTHLGPNTEFAKLTRTPEFVQLQAHWTRHPEKKRGLYRYDAEAQAVEYLDADYAHALDFAPVTDGTPTGGPHPGVRSPRAVAQELDIDTAGSNLTLFDPLVIRRLQRAFACDPYWEGDVDYDRNTGECRGLVERKGGPLKLWCRLDADGRPPLAPYAVGVDASAGKGATPSCVSIGNALTREKVAEYANANIYPDDLAPLVVALCNWFRDENDLTALLCWEQQGSGDTFGKHVIELGYRRLWYPVDPLKIGDVSDATRPGWSPLGRNKPVLLREYQGALQGMRFTNRSLLALEECLAFKFDKSGKIVHSNEASLDDPSGATVNHADRVIADAILWMLTQFLLESLGLGRPWEKKPEEQGPPPFNSLLWRRQEREAKRREHEYR
jgi:hypothetical protein